ncbi:acyl-CoA dehydrogenase [Streptococcus dysgalactiae subsp. equisimilis 167]|nr:acyl-CoA dehydrogenase [Streptococcus dysgalactiae subsp. equisimilis 167]
MRHVSSISFFSDFNYYRATVAVVNFVAKRLNYNIFSLGKPIKTTDSLTQNCEDTI